MYILNLLEPILKLTYMLTEQTKINVKNVRVGRKKLICFLAFKIGVSQKSNPTLTRINVNT